MISCKPVQMGRNWPSYIWTDHWENNILASLIQVDEWFQVNQFKLMKFDSDYVMMRLCYDGSLDDVPHSEHKGTNYIPTTAKHWESKYYFEWKHVLSSMQPIGTVQFIHTGTIATHSRNVNKPQTSRASLGQLVASLATSWQVSHLSVCGHWPPTDLWLQAEYVYLHLASHGEDVIQHQIDINCPLWPATSQGI